MNNLKQLLTKPLAAPTTKFAVFIFVVALLGFVDASYLTIEHYRGVVPPCSITGGCEQVLTSAYAIIAGIPVALWGALYYLAILIGIFAFLEGKNTKLLKWSLLFTIPGIIFSIWFVFLQVFILKSYCAYCLVSAIITTILFISAVSVFNKNQKVSAPQN